MVENLSQVFDSRGAVVNIEVIPWRKYRKRPVVIEAFQLDSELSIQTLEGTMKASPGDYLIKGIEGELYACKAAIFKKTYEELK